MRDKAVFGLTQLELAHAELLRVDQERERARQSAIRDSTQRLFDAIHAAEGLTKAVRNELALLHAGSWSRDVSEIPRFTQTLSQRIRYFLTLRDDVPHDIIALEKEAEAEIARSWAYLESILGGSQ